MSAPMITLADVINHFNDCAKCESLKSEKYSASTEEYLVAAIKRH